MLAVLFALLVQSVAGLKMICTSGVVIMMVLLMVIMLNWLPCISFYIDCLFPANLQSIIGSYSEVCSSYFQDLVSAGEDVNCNDHHNARCH